MGRLSHYPVRAKGDRRECELVRQKQEAERATSACRASKKCWVVR